MTFDGLTPGEWIAFAGLMLAIMGGGVSAAIWIQRGLAEVAERLAIVETKVDLLLGSPTPSPRSHRMFAGGSR